MVRKMDKMVVTMTTNKTQNEEDENITMSVSKSAVSQSLRVLKHILHTQTDEYLKKYENIDIEKIIESFQYSLLFTNIMSED